MTKTFTIIGKGGGGRGHQITEVHMGTTKVPLALLNSSTLGIK